MLTPNCLRHLDFLFIKRVCATKILIIEILIEKRTLFLFTDFMIKIIELFIKGKNQIQFAPLLIGCVYEIFHHTKVWLLEGLVFITKIIKLFLSVKMSTGLYYIQFFMKYVLELSFHPNKASVCFKLDYFISLN